MLPKAVALLTSLAKLLRFRSFEGHLIAGFERLFHSPFERKADFRTETSRKTSTRTLLPAVHYGEHNGCAFAAENVPAKRDLKARPRRFDGLIPQSLGVHNQHGTIYRFEHKSLRDMLFCDHWIDAGTKVGHHICKGVR